MLQNLQYAKYSCSFAPFGGTNFRTDPYALNDAVILPILRRRELFVLSVRQRQHNPIRKEPISMNLNRRLLVLTLAGTLSLGLLSACGGGNTPAPETTPSAIPSPQATAAPTASPTCRRSPRRNPRSRRRPVLRSFLRLPTRPPPPQSRKPPPFPRKSRGAPSRPLPRRRARRPPPPSRPPGTTSPSWICPP